MSSLWYLYVCLGDQGIIKVGTTTDPRKRKSGLSREFLLRGQAIARMESTGGMNYSYGVERQLIQFMYDMRYPPLTGNEWFASGDFEVVMAEANRLAEIMISRDSAKALLDQEAREKSALKKAAAEFRKDAIAAAVKAQHFEEFMQMLRDGKIQAP